jgi:uncharacterized protein (TIRG00374 family)
LRDKLLTILKVLVSLGLVTYLLWKVDVAQVWLILARANQLLLLLALFLYLGAISANALKWYILLLAQRIEVPFASVLAYTFVGAFFSNILPTNVGGDVVRGYGLARRTEQAAEAAISVVVDRVVGLMAFMSAAVASAAVVVFFTGRKDLEGVELAALVGLIAIGGGFAVLLSRRVRARAERLFCWSLLAPLAPLYGRLSEALAAYRYSYKALALAFCASLLTLLLSNLVNYCLAEALGGGIPLLYIFLFNPLVGFILLVPISVGGLGVNQGAYVFLYGLVGVPQRLALAVSLLMQTVIYISSLPGGVLWWTGRADARAGATSAESCWRAS